MSLSVTGHRVQKFMEALGLISKILLTLNYHKKMYNIIRLLKKFDKMSTK